MLRTTQLSGPTRSRWSGSTTAPSSPCSRSTRSWSPATSCSCASRGRCSRPGSIGAPGRGSGSSPMRPTALLATSASACAGRPAAPTTSRAHDGSSAAPARHDTSERPRNPHRERLQLDPDRPLLAAHRRLGHRRAVPDRACSGSPCTFAQVATVGGATTSYSNTGLSPSTLPTGCALRTGPPSPTSAPTRTPRLRRLRPRPTRHLRAPPEPSPRAPSARPRSSSPGSRHRRRRRDDVPGTCEAARAARTSPRSPLGTSTSHMDVFLNASTTYRYRVRAEDAAQNRGPYSNTATATTPAPPDTTPPSAPGTLTASAFSSTQIDLAWQPATDDSGTVAQYLIERCSGSPCTFAQIATVGGATTSYSNTGLSPSTAYSYRVRAQDGAPSPTSAPTRTPPAQAPRPRRPPSRSSPTARWAVSPSPTRTSSSSTAQPRSASLSTAPTSACPVGAWTRSPGSTRTPSSSRSTRTAPLPGITGTIDDSDLVASTRARWVRRRAGRSASTSTAPTSA